MIDALAADRLLAIIRGENAAASIDASLTLLDAGVRFLEISLTTDCALDVIATVVRDAPAGAMIGAGTVLTAEDATRVRDAGATFAVTPAVSAGVHEAVRIGLPVLAGALTPTEIVSAMSLGAGAVKLFPAGLGGPAYLKALRDPLPTVPFVPVGGVGVEQAREYLALGAIAVGVGGPLLGDAGNGGSLAALRSRAAEFIGVVRGADGVRGAGVVRG